MGLKLINFDQVRRFIDKVCYTDIFNLNDEKNGFTILCLKCNPRVIPFLTLQNHVLDSPR